MPLPLLVHAHRNDDGEGGAYTKRRLQIDTAAMHLDQPPRDRQSKPGATFLPRDAVVNLLKLLEDPRLLRGRNARTGVLHRDVELAVDGLDADLDRAGIGEFDRIADEIEQHLAQPPLVAAADRQAARNRGLDLDALVLRKRTGRRHDRFDDPLHRIVVERQGELAGLDLGYVEHVVDQPQEVLSVGLDATQDLHRLLRHGAVKPVDEQLGKAEHGVQRRAQLVAHIGEELRLVLIRDRRAGVPFARLPGTAAHCSSRAPTDAQRSA